MKGDTESSAESSAIESLGVELSNIDKNVARGLGLKDEKGVVVTSVTPGSLAERVGLESGMVIAQINRQPVNNMTEANEILKDYKAGDGLLLLIKTAEGSRFVAIN